MKARIAVTGTRRRYMLAAAAAAALAVTPVVVQVAPADAAIPGAPWSKNLLGGDKANFEQSAGGWIGIGKTGVRNERLASYTGKGALMVVNRGATPHLVIAQSGGGPASFTPATPGYRYRGYFYVRALTDVRPVAGALTFFDANGQSIETVIGLYLQDNANKWERSTEVAAVAPPNAAYVALRAAIKGAVPLEAHLVDAAYLAKAPGGSRNLVGPLRTTGNKIYDANNKPVIFRGFSRTGLEGQVLDDGTSVAKPPTADDITHAKLWGANLIRVTLGAQKWLPGCYQDPAYISKVDEAVQIITSRGMVALLDLHFNTIKACGRAGQQPMADAPNSLTFWSQVAARYKNQPLVAFDLYNEPHDITEAVWRNGGTLTWKGTTYQAAGMQQMYNAVRNAGANNLVIATGMSWGNLPPNNGPLAGTNIIYGIHSYTCPQTPPPNCTGHLNPWEGSVFLKRWVNFAKTKPVMVTEFGWPNPADGRYVESLLTYAEAHGWGWQLFTWGASTIGRFALLSTAGPDSNYQPAPVSMPALVRFPGS